MRGAADETVGEGFRVDRLWEARNITLKTILEAARLIKPGMREDEAKGLIAEIQARLGAPKSWHPPQVRFGANTLLPFGKKGEEVCLKKDDIYFLDLGMIFDDHEGDVGRTFAIGDDPEMRKCANDAELIWQEVRDHWKGTGATGAELYAFARRQAERRGWGLTLEAANGHRIADFPHAARARGSIEGFLEHPAPDRWILEIQIRHPERPFGAFYEDLLN